MPPRPSNKPSVASANFAAAVAQAKPLQRKPHLDALGRGDRSKLSVKVNTTLLGSVNIDDNCKITHPQAARWDYLVGIDRKGSAIAHYIEVHGAHSCDVSTIADKLEWLKSFLAKHPKLDALPRQVHWVASGAVKIPKHVPEYRRLALMQQRDKLNGPVTHLEIY